MTVMSQCPVIIDTDPGVDDALALLLAFASPEIRVELVTVVAGNVGLARTVSNARRIIALAGYRTRLAAGAKSPLRRKLVTAADIHGHDGLGGLTALRAANGGPVYGHQGAPVPASDAVAEIIRLAKHYGTRLTIVALGPLTNIALALARSPSAMRGVGRLVIMGGAVVSPGNITPSAEFNFYVDPDAADQVLCSGMPVTLVPLDVTHQVRLTQSFLRHHLGGSRHRQARAIRQMTRDLVSGAGGKRGMAMHDPLAVAVAMRPQLVTCESLPVRVETRGEHTLGQSIADRRGSIDRHSGAARIDVALGVDTDAALALFAERVLIPLAPKSVSDPRAGNSGVVVVGSANMDLYTTVRELPSPGNTVLGGDPVSGFGGKGANQAVASARAGVPTYFFGRVGDDAYGKRITSHMQEEGIVLSELGIDQARSTGVALIHVDRKGENQIVVSPGANGSLTKAHLRELPAACAQAKVLLVQLEIPLETIEYALTVAREAGITTVLNPAPAQALSKRLARLVDIVVPNESEATLLTGVAVRGVGDASAAIAALHARGFRQVVVTMGSRGVVWSNGKRTARVQARKVRSRDSTGAGDTFVGYLGAGLANGMDLGAAIARANAAAAISVTRQGAQDAIPYVQALPTAL